MKISNFTQHCLVGKSIGAWKGLGTEVTKFGQNEDDDDNKDKVNKSIKEDKSNNPIASQVQLQPAAATQSAPTTVNTTVYGKAIITIFPYDKRIKGAIAEVNKNKNAA